MKKFLALLIALVMLFALASCGNSSSSSSESTSSEATTSEDSTESETPDTSEEEDAEEPADTDAEEVTEIDPSLSQIVIGHIADLTGNEASTGSLASDALAFAVSYFNSIGGVNGHELVIAEQDSQSDSAVAKEVAQNLVENSGASVILGPTQIGHKSAVAEYVADAEVPAVYYNGTPTAAVTNNEYVIGLGGSTNQMPSAMAAYIYNELGYTTIATITQDNTGGDNYMNPLIEEFEALGGTVLDSERVPSSEGDTSNYIMKAGTCGADCIVAWLSGSQAINLWGQWYAQGISETTPMVGASHGGFTDYFIWKALFFGDNADAVDAAMEMGVYAPITYAYSVDNEENQALLDYYATYDFSNSINGADTYGDVPVGSNMFGAVWAAVQTVVECMKTLDDPTDSQALYQALQNVNTETPEGSLVIDSSRVASKDIHIVQVVQLGYGDFNYQIVKTYNDVPAEGYTE